MNLNATLLGEMITFSIFIWFTLRFVMPPIMQALEDRRTKAAEIVANNAESQRKLEEAEKSRSEAIKAAEVEAKDILLQARANGKVVTDKIEQEARRKAAKIFSDSSAQAELMQSKVEKEIKEQYIVPLVFKALEAVLKLKVNCEVNQALVEQAMTEDS